MFDAIVIGAGINGSFAALHLARHKQNVCLVEQFPLPHSRGSSCGQSRIITFLGVIQMPAGNELREESFEEWNKLQKETGVKLLRKRNIAAIGNKNCKEDLDKLYMCAEEMGSSPKWISVENFNATYKTSYPEDSLIFIDENAGILMAEKCLQTSQAHFKSLGGTVMDECRVFSIGIGEDGLITLQTSKGDLSGRRLVICAGPWSQQVLKLIDIDAPLKTRKAISYYWEILEDTPFKDISFVDVGVDSHAFGTPMIEYPSMIKVSSQGIYVNPNERDSVNMSRNKEYVMNYVRTRMPFLHPEPVIEESCMYTDSPDEIMIMDYHPIHKNIAYACGFKGTGFKSAPAVGKILAEMVLGMKLSIDISPLGMKRFLPMPKIQESYDVIVIGAGVNGSSTAYYSAKAGYKTALVEQFPIPHSRGSSGGQSRIIRLANYGIPEVTPLMDFSYKEWLNIQKETKQELLRPAPLFCGIQSVNKEEINHIASSLVKTNVHPRFIDSSTFNKEKGTTFEDGLTFIEDSSGGVLMADKCLLALQNLFQNNGGKIYDEFPVNATSITVNGNVVISGPKGQLESKKLIVCAGSWTNKFLCKLGLRLPLRPIKVGVYYWQMAQPFELSKHTFIHDTEDIHVYGLPSIEYPGMLKICLHEGVDIDPDRRDLANMDEIKEKMCKYVSKRFPLLYPSPAIEESCIYTVTPDKEMILDSHPLYKNIIFGCGFSGSGFKTGPAVGRALVELAQGLKHTFDMKAFKADRFPDSYLQISKI